VTNDITKSLHAIPDTCTPNYRKSLRCRFGFILCSQLIYLIMQSWIVRRNTPMSNFFISEKLVVTPTCFWIPKVTFPASIHIQRKHSSVSEGTKSGSRTTLRSRSLLLTSLTFRSWHLFWRLSPSVLAGWRQIMSKGEKCHFWIAVLVVQEVNVVVAKPFEPFLTVSLLYQRNVMGIKPPKITYLDA